MTKGGGENPQTHQSRWRYNVDFSDLFVAFHPNTLFAEILVLRISVDFVIKVFVKMWRPTHVKDLITDMNT